MDRNKYEILLPLPPKIDPSVTMMTVEDKPDVTYGDVGGCKEQIEKIREVVEMPLLSPERFVSLGIDPPKGALLYGPPGTGKTLCARAVANRTDATFIRVIGSELVQKYVGEGARMVRELFEMARTKKACIIFFDEIDAIGGARFDDGAGGDNEVQRTLMVSTREAISRSCSLQIVLRHLIPRLCDLDELIERSNFRYQIWMVEPIFYASTQKACR